MTTKDWFSRGRRLDAHINTLLETIDREKQALLRMTANLSGVVVDGSRDPHRFDRLAILEDSINAEIDRLYEIKLEILDVIKRLDDMRYREVLTKYYINMKSFEQIAVDMNYSYVHITRLHGWALKAAEKVMGGDAVK